MKNLLVYIIVLVSIQATSQTSPVQAEVDTMNIRIGEQFQYKISIDETKNVIIPKIQLKRLEVVDSLKPDTLKNKLIQKYILTGFDSGSYYIPKQQIYIKNQAYFTDSLLINVATVPVDTTKVKMFKIKDIKREPFQFADYKHILFWLLGILLVAVTVLYFALKRTNDNQIRTNEQLLTPYQEAIRTLKLLDNQLLWQNNKIKQYYSELTDIIRNFIERELHIPASETTTNGLIETFSGFSESNSIIADKAIIHKLHRLLQRADLVKFAKSKPLAHEIEADRNIAKHIIDNLKLSITETESSEADTDSILIVEKPMVKKPTLLIRIITILLLLTTVSLIARYVSKIQPLINSFKTPITNVQ